MAYLNLLKHIDFNDRFKKLDCIGEAWCGNNYLEKEIGLPPISDALKKLILGHSEDMDTDGTYGHEMEGDMDRAARMMEKALAKIIGVKV